MHSFSFFVNGAAESAPALVIRVYMLRLFNARLIGAFWIVEVLIKSPYFLDLIQDQSKVWSVTAILLRTW